MTKTFAGGHHNELQPMYSPPIETPPQPPPVQPTPIIAPTPTPTPETPPQTPNNAGGNGMIWCSGPQAPGWNVSLPNGGCSTTTPQKSVNLSQLPYTGNNRDDIEMSASFYLLIIGLALSAIPFVLRYLQRHKVW